MRLINTLLFLLVVQVIFAQANPYSQENAEQKALQKYQQETSTASFYADACACRE